MCTVLKDVLWELSALQITFFIKITDYTNAKLRIDSK